MVVLTSCSNDDSPANPSDSSNVLIKKIIIESIKEGTTEINFTYDGKKLVEQKGSGYFNYTKRFYYTGDLITRYEMIWGPKSTFVTDLTYEKGKLKTLYGNRNYILTGLPYIQKKTYTYNLDGSVSFVIDEIDKDTHEILSSRTGRLTYVNGNMVKDQRFDDPTGYLSMTLDYDTKNNPFKNIIGLNLVLGYYDSDFSVNNVSKLTTNGIYSSPWSVSYVYEYDENNFPTVAKHFDDKGNVYQTTKYFY